MTCDFNNDGRQDLAVFFDGIGPQLFFNRGFRSFGHGLDLCPTVQNMDAEDAGQQAGCVADLNGDGLQDMALVLKRGEVMTFFQSPEDASSVAASVAVAPDGGRVGPVSVSGWAGGRSLGVWLVAGAGCGAHFGMPDPGPLRLRWSFPGGGTHEKEWELTRALGVAVGP
jgi:hypothetical protein